MLCLFALSCEDNSQVCANYFLTEATSPGSVDRLFYNDNGLLDVVIQTATGWPSRRDEYTYNGDHQLIRVDVGDEFVYTEFSYDGGGRLELVQMYSASDGSLSREVKYFYSSDGKLSRRDIHNNSELTFYGLYEYPADNIIEVRTFSVKDDGTFEENPLSIYTMDNNPKPYPEEYYTAFEAWAGIWTPHNIVSYQVVKNGVVDPTYSYTTGYKYNHGGYPVSMSGATFSYSCEPVKEL